MDICGHKAENQPERGNLHGVYVPDLCGVYYLEIKYRNEDKRERLYGNFTEGTEDKNTQNIENTEKGSSFYPEELPFLRVYLFNRKSMQSVICGRCGIKENFYVESNRLYKNRRTKSKERT